MILDKKPYIIGETAFHHEGDLTFLNSLIDSLEKTDVNAIKFHLLFDLRDYIIDEHPAIDVLNKIAIQKENWEDIFKKVLNFKKDIILLCNDLESLSWVNSVQEHYKIKAIELHSTGLNDIFLLSEAVSFKETVILGVGGSTFDEVQYAVEFLKENGKNDILLMHGFQNYPTDYKEINLRRMSLLQNAFELPVGYADHTDPKDKYNSYISTLPQALGFNILEKHFTHKFGEDRIDSQAAVSIDALKEIVELANVVYATKGDQAYQFSESEKKYGNTGPMKKAIVARKKIEKGERLTFQNLAFKRTEKASPLLQKDFVKIIDTKASKDILKDEIISYSNIEYQFKKGDFNQFFIKK